MRKARTICSAASRSPSENSDVAVTTSRGSAFSAASWAAQVAAFAGIARQSIEALEGAPARRQGRVDVHCAQQRVDGAGRILLHDAAEAALLVEAAEARLQRFEPPQRRQGVVDPQQVALADRPGQQQVAVLGPVGKQRLGPAERLVVAAVLL